MRHFAALVGCLVVVWIGTGSAKAHYLAKPRPWSKMSVGAKHHYLRDLKAHASYVVREGSGRPKHWHRLALRRIDRRLRVVRRQLRPALYIPVGIANGLLCIHRYEGSWTDTGDPYWGGLQMNRTFMVMYAPEWLLRKGWANAWTPWEQMWVAYRAIRRGRGWYPWPNTARMCGLL
jgi:hypothetical protein